MSTARVSRRIQIVAESILDDDGWPPAVERIARTPASHVIRGLFFRGYVDALAGDWETIARTLDAPPALGAYLPLVEYPQSDHARLALAVAARRYPTLPMREALRRLERRAARAFSESALGRILISVAGDPRKALLHLPSIYRNLQGGGTIEARNGPRGVRLELRGFAPWLDCSWVGVIEGLVVLFGRRPVLSIDLHGEESADYEVEWT